LNATNVRPIPEGYTAVTPWIISRDTARFIDFITAAFGAEELARVVGEDGSIGHAECRIGDAIVLAFDAKPDWPDTPAFLRLYVDDADATYRKALAAGATSVTEVTHLFWGDRVGRVRDPLGNLWWIQTRVEDVDDAEMARRMSEPEWLERMAYVQSSLAFAPLSQAERRVRPSAQ
jgi:PhnB protein